MNEPVILRFHLRLNAGGNALPNVIIEASPFGKRLTFSDWKQAVDNAYSFAQKFCVRIRTVISGFAVIFACGAVLPK